MKEELHYGSTRPWETRTTAMLKTMQCKILYKKVNMMSSTFTIRVTPELKERMKKIPVKWSDEIRVFIEERVRHLELIESIEEIESRAGKRQLKVDSTLLIREDGER